MVNFWVSEETLLASTSQPAQPTSGYVRGILVDCEHLSELELVATATFPATVDDGVVLSVAKDADSNTAYYAFPIDADASATIDEPYPVDVSRFSEVYVFVTNESSNYAVTTAVTVKKRLDTHQVRQD